MAKSNSNSSSGIGFFGLMFLIFMTLKLTGHITWSWWWVTAPLWGGFVFAGMIAIIAIVLYLTKNK
jgi:hypothetical protein